MPGQPDAGPAESARAQAGGLGGLYNRAQRALQNGDYAKAIGAFQNYLDAAKDSKDPAVLNTLDACITDLDPPISTTSSTPRRRTKLAELLKRFPKFPTGARSPVFPGPGLVFQGGPRQGPRGIQTGGKNTPFPGGQPAFSGRGAAQSRQGERCRRSARTPGRRRHPLRQQRRAPLCSSPCSPPSSRMPPKAIDLLTELSGNLRFLPECRQFQPGRHRHRRRPAEQRQTGGRPRGLSPAAEQGVGPGPAGPSDRPTDQTDRLAPAPGPDRHSGQGG